jgi:hypothetical protein
MFFRVPDHLRQTSFGWLLGLLLLLPLAQSMAARHEVSHLGAWGGLNAGAESARQRDGSPLPHDGEACSLCLAAATIGAGGLPAVALLFVAPGATPARIAVARVDAPATPPATAYRSRAPPPVS